MYVFRFPLKCLLLFQLVSASAYGVLAGGRPNSISGGQNAFAGVVNPANAVWIKDRFDIGIFLVRQKFTVNNPENSILYPPGKTDLTYRTRTLFTTDIAIHKRFKVHDHESSFSLAAYSTPAHLKLRTKVPIPASGTTPVRVEDKVQVFSAVFSVKLNPAHSVGLSLDYFYLTHRRNGFQRADNPLRSVSPGHVTNNGFDHSSGVGLSLGWRWNINESLTFGAAYIKKSYVGQYRKYRGYEPHHAQNYIPQTFGAGFTYRFTKKMAGRLEVLWTNLRNLPNANNNVIDGQLNTNKRGSNYSPGPGLQDATFINLGIGYNVNPSLSFGLGYSHRVRVRHTSLIISHTYGLQTTYDLLAFGINFNWKNNDFFLTCSHSFRNRESGHLPAVLGGKKLITNKRYDAISFAWGYLY